MPVKIIKSNKGTFSKFVFRNFNNSIFDATFPSELKNMWFRYLKRKNGTMLKTVLQSKIYEKCVYYQIYKYFNHVLSKWEHGFCKGFSTQYCLLVITNKWLKCLDIGVITGAILTDLSKAFDCSLHDISITKFAAYCSNTSLQNHREFSYQHRIKNEN